jgi:biotin synthase
MHYSETLKDKIIRENYRIIKADALRLVEEPLAILTQNADALRTHFCGNAFDMCTIINAKSGRCSENCRYCAQSVHYKTDATEYSLLGEGSILEEAKKQNARGVPRFSLVTSGRTLSDADVAILCSDIRKIKKETSLSVCISAGLLHYDQFVKLKEAGLSRVHNNLETSRRNFSNVCTTHTYDDKIAALKAAQRAGLSLCSGGIMGLGETVEDRIDMVLDIRELGVRSIPVNVLNAIPGTPYENLPKLTNDEVCRIVAIYRFIVPEASIRLAGGRGLLGDKGEKAFRSGANATISGDMLTTAGISVETDRALLQKLGYVIQEVNL